MFRLFAALLLLVPLQALAGDWRVVPIRLFLNQKSRSDSVRLINSGTTPLTLQVNAATWSQSAQGEDQYQPTDELIFFPRLLTIPPGEERILRAGFKLPPAERERTYRLFIQEIPEPQPAGNSSVQIAVRFGLPVFIAPQQPKHAARIDDFSLTAGTVALLISNQGNRHVLPGSVVLTGLSADGNALYSHSLKPWYILSGNSRSYSQPLSADECRKTASLRLEFTAEDLHLVRDLQPGPGACTP